MKSKVFRLMLICILIFSSFTGFFLVENCSASGNTIYVDDDNTEGPWTGTQEHPFQKIQDGIDVLDAVLNFLSYLQPQKEEVLLIQRNH